MENNQTPFSQKEKEKDGSLPTNYRPISLLPNINKNFEIIINDTITCFCNSQNIILENQFGFQFKHSKTHAICKFTSDIYWAKNAGDCASELC